MHIFISYGRDEHVPLARQLRKDLLARGHEVWFDEEKLNEGGDWENYIEEGLNFCAALLERAGPPRAPPVPLRPIFSRFLQLLYPIASVPPLCLSYAV